MARYYLIPGFSFFLSLLFSSSAVNVHLEIPLGQGWIDGSGTISCILLLLVVLKAVNLGP